MAALHPNIVVKVPCIEAGIKAIKYFTRKGIRTNCTLVFSVGQALLAAKAGATYVSPFVGRLDDIASDGIELVRKIVEMYDYYDYDTLVARTVQGEQSMYVYQLPGDAEYPYVRILSCEGLTENKQYYVFSFYTEYYTSTAEPFFTHSSYSTSFAVNRETGEVLQE